MDEFTLFSFFPHPHQKSNKSFLNNFNDLSIYPNPSIGSFRVEFNIFNSKKWKLRVHNSIGQIIKSYDGKSNNEPSKSIFIDNLPAGLYHVSIQIENKLLSKKLIIFDTE